MQKDAAFGRLRFPCLARHDVNANLLSMKGLPPFFAIEMLRCAQHDKTFAQNDKIRDGLGDLVAAFIAGIGEKVQQGSEIVWRECVEGGWHDGDGGGLQGGNPLAGDGVFFAGEVEKLDGGGGLSIESAGEGEAAPGGEDPQAVIAFDGTVWVDDVEEDVNSAASGDAVKGWANDAAGAFYLMTDAAIDIEDLKAAGSVAAFVSQGHQ